MKTRFRIPAMMFLAAILCTVFVVSCKDDDTTPATDFTALKASITAAQAQLTATEEGKNDGQYSATSRAALQSAITSAQAVVDNSATTQDQANAANVQLGLAVTAYAAAVITPIAVENLIAHWSFDEGTGTTVTDESANAFVGTFKKGPVATGWGGDLPTWAADRKGVAGKAIAFDKGSNIEVPYNTKLNPAKMTISVWTYTAETRKDNRFIGLQSWVGYKFQFQDGDRPYFTINTDGGTREEDAGIGVPIKQWHHIVATFGDGKLIFYIDGELAKSWDKDSSGKSISAKPYNLVIGEDFPADKYAATTANFDDKTSAEYQVIPLEWGGYYHGTLDELRLYNTALTAAQVASLYDREKP